MTLDPIQLLCLRAADGELSSEEEARLVAAGEDPGAWRQLPAVVRGALLHGGPVPELAPAVLAAVGLHDVVLPLAEALQDEVGAEPQLSGGVLAALELEGADLPIRAAVHEAAGAEPELAGSVLAALGLARPEWTLAEALLDEAGAGPALADQVVAATELEDGSGLVREALHAALEQEAPVDFASAVMAELGIGAQAETDLVAQALRAEAGPAPSLWDAVAGALDLEDASEVAADDVVVPLRPVAPAARSAPASASPTRRWERWAMASAGLAAAAALLIFATQTDTTVAPESLAAIELSPVNEVEFEDIYSEAMVQVIDGEDEMPTIIFITEPVEGDLFDDEEGRL